VLCDSSPGRAPVPHKCVFKVAVFSQYSNGYGTVDPNNNRHRPLPHRFRINTVSWLSSDGDTLSQTPFCMRDAFWRPIASFELSTPPRTTMLRGHSQQSSPEIRETAKTYPPRSPSYTQRWTKPHFRKSSWGMRLARSHIHAEWRASSSLTDAGCAQSNVCSGWTAPRTG